MVIQKTYFTTNNNMKGESYVYTKQTSALIGDESTDHSLSKSDINIINSNKKMQLRSKIMETRQAVKVNNSSAKKMADAQNAQFTQNNSSTFTKRSSVMKNTNFFRAAFSAITILLVMSISAMAQGSITNAGTLDKHRDPKGEKLY